MLQRLLLVAPLFYAAFYIPAAIQVADQQPPKLKRQPKQLTFDGLFKRDPVFVSKGEEIVYTVENKSPRLVLKKLKLSDGISARLHPTAALPHQKATFSRDEKTYLYLALTGNDMTAANVHSVATNETKSLKFSKPVAWDPFLTSDGSRVVVSLDGQIVSMSITDGREQRLTKSSGLNNWPNVDRMGKRIVFGSSRKGDYEIYMMDIDGSNVLRLTESRGLDARPCFSPDGRQIAFTSARDGNYEIYVMDADGSNVRRITGHPERDDFAAWHPAGEGLVVISERGGRYDLFLYRVAKQAAVQDQVVTEKSQ